LASGKRLQLRTSDVRSQTLDLRPFPSLVGSLESEAAVRGSEVRGLKSDAALHQQDEGKQRILKLLNLEDLSPIYAFAIERSRGVFSVAGRVPEQFSLHRCSWLGGTCPLDCQDVLSDEFVFEELKFVGVTLVCSPTRNGFSKTVHQPARMTGVIMSRVNGDKSRYNRIRKQNAAKRMRNRKLLKNADLQAKPVASAVASEPKPVVA